MVKKTAAKTAGIDMSSFHPKPRAVEGQTSKSDKTYTGLATVIHGLTGSAEVATELKTTRATLEATQGRLVEAEKQPKVHLLDPKTIRRSALANRIEAEFATPTFAAFRREILATGGNVQPIKVRPLDGVIDGQYRYEIAYGHRRHRACFEENLSVNAIVEEMDDKKLFEEMERENRGRKNLSAWEQGCMYAAAVKANVYPNLLKLTEALGVNYSDAQRAVTLAGLPAAVVVAFPSPLELQVRWAKPLKDAAQDDIERLLERARALHEKRGQLSALEVFDALTQVKKSASVEIKAKGKTVATMRSGAKGRTVVEFESDALLGDRRDELLRMLREFLKE